ncbi:MAG: cupin-like domain-containing protein [Gammaproteobacteria bacterium]
MSQSPKALAVLDNCTIDALTEDVLTSKEPLILKGLVAEWPVVQAGRQSPKTAADYIQSFDQNKPLTAYEGPADISGRIFYNDDFTGFNFSRTRQTLQQVLDKVFHVIEETHAPTYYVGSTMIDHWLPGFRDENDLDLADRERLVSIWLGNRSRIAAHYDFPSNIACSVVGRRRFTLFPPEQASNLYVGPLEFTPSGQPISLVDMCSPDLKKFPNYKYALAACYTAELGPGDAIFIPSMWWHHVESLESFNVLVNYWWRSTPAFQGSPLNALHHAIMSLRDLPIEQRRVWKDVFEQYVFNENEHAFDYIPEHVRGVLAGVDEDAAKVLKMQLLKYLK